MQRIYKGQLTVLWSAVCKHRFKYGDLIVSRLAENKFSGSKAVLTHRTPKCFAQISCTTKEVLKLMRVPFGDKKEKQITSGNQLIAGTGI